MLVNLKPRRCQLYLSREMCLLIEVPPQRPDHCYAVLYLLRCRPCVTIAPAFNMLSNKYPQVVFLEVDVHVCQVSLIKST